MIRIDPEAALEMIEARAYYRSRGGDHEAFTIAAIQLIDEIEANPTTFAPHPFATTPGTRRALFPRPWPFALAYIVVDDVPIVLACEHLRREPAYWNRR